MREFSLPSELCCWILPKKPPKHYLQWILLKIEVGGSVFINLNQPNASFILPACICYQLCLLCVANCGQGE